MEQEIENSRTLGINDIDFNEIDEALKDLPRTNGVRKEDILLSSATSQDDIAIQKAIHEVEDELKVEKGFKPPFFLLFIFTAIAAYILNQHYFV